MGSFSTGADSSADNHTDRVITVLLGRVSVVVRSQYEMKSFTSVHQQNDRVAVTLLRAFNCFSNVCRACVL